MSAREHRFGTVLLTGATSGIGEATARELAGRCDTLIVQGPESSAAVHALHDELPAGTASIHYVCCDCTRLDAVVAAAAEIRGLATSGIDLLINDAGVRGASERIVTADGFERTLQVNALAPALLTRLLVPALNDHSRIVNVGSSAHRVDHFAFHDVDLEREYAPVAAYARSKLAVVTWSSLLSEEFAGSSTTVLCLCQGINDTPLSAAMMGNIGGPPTHGAARVLHAAVADVPTGSYLEDRVVAPSSEVTDARNRERLIELYWTWLSPFAQRYPAGR